MLSGIVNLVKGALSQPEVVTPLNRKTSSSLLPVVKNERKNIKGTCISYVESLYK